MDTAKPTFTDMRPGGWVDRLPRRVRPYITLMRLDRPIGTWLLLLPCWWSAALAAGNPADWRIWYYGLLFAVGAVIMRGAGCAINDIADRDFDGRVERTALRPIPSGQIRLSTAIAFTGALMLAGLAVLVQFDRFAIVVGVLSVPILVAYPFMKRITDWPQAWLGLAFNWGALVGWAAIAQTLDWPAVLLYAGGICWTLGYDTIYAHQDKADDVKIGVRSSALALGNRTRPFLAAIYTLNMLFLAAAFWRAGSGPWAWPLLALGAAHLAWQVITVDTENQPNCLARFRSNRDFGLIVTAAALLAHV
ncbi:4-hydroxybenzoate-octaprenyl transferase [uncultured Alphaproteobacteria bacterium]|uniref:4-hydroxybenzoate octaprenyltransferase n=1 Tax=uncultured Alphaproteobacteria bacterium TaxID=91750 RepID=A0A212K729_9PROT|nr:4-hydroxybenzoate-octaprenyl transferase [uncultured Alphaproteobacteria bacterium]